MRYARGGPKPLPDREGGANVSEARRSADALTLHLGTMTLG
jgi:hypothetical protein